MNATDELRRLQRDFIAAMQGEPARALPHLTKRCRIGPELGLGIYRNAYHARLVEALENDHAILGRYLGDTLWQRLCEGYIAAYPSRYRSLRQFGDHLPDWLQSAEPFAAHPQIAELACFERRLLDVFDAADGPRADANALHALAADAWPTLRLRFHPSLQRLQTTTNCVDLWRALRDEQPPPPVARQPGDWALWRDETNLTQFRSLAPEEAAALEHVLHGGDFAGLCERLLHWQAAEDVPARALHYLQSWLQAGWVRNFGNVVTDMHTP